MWTISYDNEARLHWLQWLLFCPPRSQQLSHSRILIEPDYLSIFSHCKYIQSKCSGNSTLKPLKSVNCGIHRMRKVHWKSGHSEKLYFFELKIFAVCASRIDFKNWFWQNSRIHCTAITKKDYESWNCSNRTSERLWSHCEW